MATYTPVSRSVSSPERTSLITDVGVGDQIDVVDVLGRPARGAQFYTSDVTDEVQYKLNSLRRMHEQRTKQEALSDMDRAFGVYGKDEVLVWSANSDTFASVGEIIETQEGLNISSIEIVALTLDTGTTISIVVW